MTEIDNFRKKYPSYNDLGDTELAGMLAKKYPKAYGDLPGNVELPGQVAKPAQEPTGMQSVSFPEDPFGTAGPRPTMPADAQDIGRVLGTLVESSGPVPKWGRESPNLYGVYGAGKGLMEHVVRPSVETAGAITGSLAGPVIGTALGYGMGKKSADIAEDIYANIGREKVPERTITGELTGSVVDVGSAMAIGKTFQVAGPAIGKSADYLFGDLPKKLYGSAVKMPLSKKWVQELPGKEVSKRTAAVEEGIRSRVPPSEFGIAKAKRLEKEVRKHVDDSLKILSEDPTKKVKLQKILDSGLAGARIRAKNSSDVEGSLKIIDKIEANLKAGRPESLNPTQLNALKRELYKEVKWGIDVDPMTAAAKKGVSHNIMKRLQSKEMYPELKSLNKTDAARIGLEEALERAVPRIGNRNIVPLGTKFLLTNPATWPLAVWDATVGHPQIKARLAFALSRANPGRYSKFIYPDKPVGYAPPGVAARQVYRYKPEFKGEKSKPPKPLKTTLGIAEPASKIRHKANVIREKSEAERLHQIEMLAAKQSKTIGSPLAKPGVELVKSTRRAPVKTTLRRAEPASMVKRKVDAAREKDERGRLKHLEAAFRRYDQQKARIGPALIKPSAQKAKSIPPDLKKLLRGLK